MTSASFLPIKPVIMQLSADGIAHLAESKQVNAMPLFKFSRH
jgi:hypothetical protein